MTDYEMFIAMLDTTKIAYHIERDKSIVVFFNYYQNNEFHLRFSLEGKLLDTELWYWKS